MAESFAISRRRFAHLLGAGAAYAVAQRGTSLGSSMRPVERALDFTGATTVVRLNSNENPYGPSPMALKAMTDAFSLAWRYPDEHADLLIETLARINGVNRDQILLGDGSGEILKMCASAFTGPMSSRNSRSATGASDAWWRADIHAGSRKNDRCRSDLRGDSQSCARQRRRGC